MSDDIDALQQKQEFEHRIHLYKSRRSVPAIQSPVGYCLNCGEKLADRRWCDATCRNEWLKKENSYD